MRRASVYRALVAASLLAAALGGCGGGGGGGAPPAAGPQPVPSVCGGEVTSTPVLCNLTVTPDPVTVGGSIAISFGISDLEGDINAVCVGLALEGTPPVIACVAVEPGNTLINETITTDSIPLTDGAGAPLPDGAYEIALIVGDAAGHTSNVVSATFTISPPPVSSPNVTVLASGIQRPASLVIKGSRLFFTDSSDMPLKKVSVTGGSVTALARRMGAPENIAVHGQDILWIEGRRLNKTSLDGTVTIVLASGERDLVAGATADFVVDDTDVYWVTTVSSLTCSPSCTWVIQKVPISGGVPTTLANTRREIVALTGDATHIYWEERGIEPVTPGCQCGSAIKKVPKTGGEPTVLVDGLLNGLLPPPPPGHIAGSWFPTGGIAVNGPELFFGESGTFSYRVMKLSISGGPIIVLGVATTPLEFAINSILDITVDGTNVYWIDTGNSTLNTIPVNGGSPTILAVGLNAPVRLTVSAGNASWTESGTVAGCCLQMATGRIRTVPLTGGPVSTVLDGIDAPGAMAIDPLNIYWTEFWRIAKAPSSGGGPIITVASGISSDLARIAADEINVYILDGDLIKKVPINGGVVEKLGPAHGGNIGDFGAQGQDIATDGINVYWTIMPDQISLPMVRTIPIVGGPVVTLAAEGIARAPQDCRARIAVDSKNVYWSSAASFSPVGCAIKKVPITGGPVTGVVDDSHFPDFVVDGENIYFADRSTAVSTIRKISVDGGQMSTVTTTFQLPWVITADDFSLYWIDPTDTAGGIGKVPKAGGIATLLVTGPLEADPVLAAIGVDQSSVYWTESVGGTIKRATPK